MNPLEQLETALAPDHAQELAEPNLARVLEEESIHQLLDDLLGRLDEDEASRFHTHVPTPEFCLDSEE